MYVKNAGRGAPLRIRILRGISLPEFDLRYSRTLGENIVGAQTELGGFAQTHPSVSPRFLELVDSVAERLKLEILLNKEVLNEVLDSGIISRRLFASLSFSRKYRSDSRDQALEQIKEIRAHREYEFFPKIHTALDLAEMFLTRVRIGKYQRQVSGRFDR